MPTLLCATREPGGAALEGIAALVEAGVGVVLLAPGGGNLAGSAQAVETALENQELARVQGPPLPEWLEAADFERVLVVSEAADAAELTEVEKALLEALLSAGCESVELLPPEALPELSQSWYSGRRVGWIAGAKRMP